jgi:SAM-dependent methyltransferase
VDQFVPEVTDADVERIIERDYPADKHAEIRELIRGIEVREKPRVVLACLKNGKGDLDRLKGELTNASGWYRESILEAEYPNYSKKMFRIERLPPEEQERIIEADKTQYLKWLVTEPLPDYVLQNRGHWDGLAKSYAASAARHWTEPSPSWGIWGIPESEVGMIPADIAGKDVIELGCGTAYVAAWLARAGARVTGIDNSEAQLATARRMQMEHGLDFPLVHGNAEAVPCPDASFHFAVSEYGACLWADPYKWVPEAARILRPGGRLHFLTNGYVHTLCAPELETESATDRLRRPAFGLHRLEWPDDTGVEFHLTHGSWIRLLRENGFQIHELLELRPPEGATTRFPYVTAEWARQWPSEEVWKVRKR